ncbi:DUF4129 domain-containing protein [Natronobiforma cellulositropha]|uniref:DUF4129 domain-containing protein n=1 Tax=Natronobiforma cellulositropha TaxID=1679076 RepID=UPI0021D5F8C0|nr:DUF4129 domain-containing protein [Natronobiforma cellulositropha]
MAYDLQRVALIACCVFAVVVAASLFPAAGYGEYPGSGTVDSGFYDGEQSTDGPTAPTDGPDDTEPEDSEGPGTDEERDESSTDDDSEPDAADESPDDDTDDADDADDGSAATSDDGGPVSSQLESITPLLSGFFWLILGSFAVVVVVLFFVLSDQTRSSDVSSGDLPAGFLPRLRLRFQRIPQAAMAATIGLARVVPPVTDQLLTTAGGVVSAASSGTRLLSRGVGGFTTTLLAAPFSFGRSGGGFFAGLASITGGLSSLLSPHRRTRRSSARDSGDAPAEHAASQSEPDLGPQTVEEAWEAMVENLPVRRRHARTPGEYARTATDAGFPSRAVSDLTAAFRDVRYGGYPPSPDRTRRAREAFSEIERARDDSEDGGRP